MEFSAKILVTCGEKTGGVGFRCGRKTYFSLGHVDILSIKKRKEQLYLKDSVCMRYVKVRGIVMAQYVISYTNFTLSPFL